MDPNRLDINDWIAGAGAALFFLAAVFMPWYGLGGESRGNPFLPFGSIGMLVGFLAFALIGITLLYVITKLVPNTGFSMALPFKESILYVVAGAAAVLVFVFVMIEKGNFLGTRSGLGFGFGAWIGLLGGLATGAGGVLKLAGVSLGGAGGPPGYGGYPQQGYPQQGYPQAQPGYPQQGYPQAQPGYPPPQPQPQPGYPPPQGQPQPGYPPQGQPGYPPPPPQQGGYPPPPAQ